MLLGAFVGLLSLLYLILIEDSGVQRIARLNADIERQTAENRKIEIDNSLLRIQIADVKNRPETKEAMARYQLNMIRPGEVFIQTPNETR